MSRDCPLRDYDSLSAVVSDRETAALFCVRGGNIMDEQKINWRRFPFPYDPEPMPRPMEPPVCTDHPECVGCPYPTHGFICQSRDGACMKTNMEKLWEAKRK